MAEYTGPLMDAPPKQYKPLQPAVQPTVRPVAPQSAQAPSAPPLNAQPPELVPRTAPPNLTPKARNEFNLAEANRIAAEKIRIEGENRKELKPTTDFSAKVKKLKDFEGYLKDYETELNKDLMVFPKEIPILPSQGLAIPLPVGSDTARMNSKYTALLMGLKDAYELGALTGPDMGIVESQITNPATIAGAMTSRNAMQEQVKVMKGILDRGKQNLESAYGKKMDNAPAAPAVANDPLGLRGR